jgi:hypothetical protein
LEASFQGVGRKDEEGRLACGHLAGVDNGRVQDSADQHQLQRRQVGDRHLVDHVDGRNEGKEQCSRKLEDQVDNVGRRFMPRPD